MHKDAVVIPNAFVRLRKLEQSLVDIGRHLKMFMEAVFETSLALSRKTAKQTSLY